MLTGLVSVLLASWASVPGAMMEGAMAATGPLRVFAAGSGASPSRLMDWSRPMSAEMAFALGFSLICCARSCSAANLRRFPSCSFSAISAAAVRLGTAVTSVLGDTGDEEAASGAPGPSGVLWRLRGLDGRSSCFAPANAAVPPIVRGVETGEMGSTAGAASEGAAGGDGAVVALAMGCARRWTGVCLLHRLCEPDSG